MVTDIETALRQALPADLQDHVPALAQLLADASSRTISPTDAEAHLGMLQIVLHALEGKSITIRSAVIDFGRGNDQHGMSVTISGDVASGNIVKLTGSPSSSVQELSTVYNAHNYLAIRSPFVIEPSYHYFPLHGR